MKSETLTQPKMNVMQIGPTKAKELLDANPANRRLTQSIVNRYAKSMSENKWKFNGETIKTDVDGKVLDGQHRLAAIVQSGVTLRFFVVSNLPREVFDTLDTGKARSSGDALYASGIKTNAPVVAAIANLALKMETDSLKNNRYIEPHAVREWVEKHPGIEVAATEARRMSTILGFAPVLGLVYMLAHQIDADAADSFFKSIYTGELIGRGDPAYALREALIRHKSDRAMHKATVLSMVLRAWNAYKSEEKLTVLKKPKSTAVPNGYAYAL